MVQKGCVTRLARHVYERNWERIGAKRSERKRRTKVSIVLQASQRGPRRRFIQGGFILTVIEREVARGAARQNPHRVNSSGRSSEEQSWDDDMLICEICR